MSGILSASKTKKRLLYICGILKLPGSPGNNDKYISWEDHQKNVNDVLVIGIAGGSGSGKTTLAKYLEQQLGEKILLLSHDSYYRAHGDMPLEERKTLNYDHPDALETSLLVEHLKLLKDGHAIHCPNYDFTTHNRSGRTTYMEPRKVIIVEGILVFENKELRDLLDIRIFVDTEADIRLCRRIRRDVVERGRTVESVLTQYEETVQPMYMRFVEPSKRYASMIVYGGKDESVRKMLLNHITNYLGNG